MTFTESNAAEQMILDAVAKAVGLGEKNLREDLPPGYGESLGGELRPARWDYLPTTHPDRAVTAIIKEDL